MPNHSGNDFRQPRKCQTIREMTFAERGNAKPFGKWLSPSAEMPNLSGNDFRRARKCQTFRETTFAKRGNTKPFGKWLSPCAETPNHSGNDFRHARKLQTFYGMICGRPASIKSFKKWFAGGPQATNPLKNNLQIKILLLHQKDKLKNKIKQDHFKWFYRATLHDYNRASLNEPKGTTLDEYFHYSNNSQSGALPLSIVRQFLYNIIVIFNWIIIIIGAFHKWRLENSM